MSVHGRELSAHDQYTTRRVTHDQYSVNKQRYAIEDSNANLHLILSSRDAIVISLIPVIKSVIMSEIQSTINEISDLVSYLVTG